MTRIHVVIATLGRPELVRQTVARLARQTRAPDGIVLATVTPADVAGADVAGAEGAGTGAAVTPEVILARKGLCCQRNRALEHLRDRTDIILFLDDDFVPKDDYVAELEALFAARPDLVGTCGRIIADGIKTAGIGFDEAVALVEADVPPADPREDHATALYGCNMAIRMDAAKGLAFDEALPLYGWLEDIDFTHRLSRRGALCRSDRFAGVHMGTKGGRTSGVRIGYSQLANPIHMLRKQSAPPRLAWTMMSRNVASNVARSFRPEPWVDRRGRLRGNLIALADLVRGRLDPRRILELE